MKRKSGRRLVTRRTALGKAEGEFDRPDVDALYQHWNRLYFESKLGACSVKWSSQKTRCPGRCSFTDGLGEILLSEPLLKARHWADVRATLFHEMIHAHVFLASSNDHRDHELDFQLKMDEICEFQGEDEERPQQGYTLELNKSMKACAQAAAEEVSAARKRISRLSHKRFRTKVVEVCAHCAGLQREQEQLEPPVASTALVPLPPPVAFEETRGRKRSLACTEDRKTCKVPRLEYFCSKKTDRTPHRSDRVASRKTPVAQRPHSPNVVIAALDWAAYEPEEEEGDKLIDRRWQRKQEEKARQAVMTLAEECSRLECEDRREADDDSKALVIYEGGSSDRMDLVLADAPQRADERCVEAYAGYEMFDLTTAMVVYEPPKPSTDREVKCFERRGKKETARAVPLAEEKSRGVVKAKAKPGKTRATPATQCPLCNKVFGFDLENPHDNAKFNTHVDECLNRGFA